RVALLGEEDVVRLHGLEGDHPQRIVGKDVDDARAYPLPEAGDELGTERSALDDESEGRAPREPDALQASADPSLVERLAPGVLVQQVVAAVCERPHLVAEGGQ